MVHRELWEELVGPIPSGYVLDHLCRERSCMNPNHEEPVTVQVNTLRGVARLFMRPEQYRLTQPLAGEQLPIS